MNIVKQDISKQRFPELSRLRCRVAPRVVLFGPIPKHHPPQARRSESLFMGVSPVKDRYLLPADCAALSVSPKRIFSNIAAFSIAVRLLLVVA